jgi:hypothetical protein
MDGANNVPPTSIAVEVALAPSPQFEACVIAAGNEALDAKHNAEALAAAAGAASKALRGTIEKKRGFLGGDKSRKNEEPVAEEYLANALSDASAAGRCDMEPLSAVLRELAPLRATLGESVHSALVTPLEVRRRASRQLGRCDGARSCTQARASTLCPTGVCE